MGWSASWTDVLQKGNSWTEVLQKEKSCLSSSEDTEIGLGASVRAAAAQKHDPCPKGDQKISPWHRGHAFAAPAWNRGVCPLTRREHVTFAVKMNNTVRKSKLHIVANGGARAKRVLVSSLSLLLLSFSFLLLQRLSFWTFLSPKCRFFAFLRAKVAETKARGHKSIVFPDEDPKKTWKKVKNG